MGKLIVVAGAQYGSEGKGAVADHLTRPERAGANVVAVRVAGPNAGHTAYGTCPPTCDQGTANRNDGHYFNGLFIGHPWRLRSVPVSAVNNIDADLVIAAGSEIDRDVLLGEIVELDAAGYRVSERLRVDSQATILDKRHIQEEVDDEIQKRLGSTAKGIGAARSARIWRYAELWGSTHDADSQVNTGDYLRMRLNQGATVMIEGTQGYGLGLHAGNYPQCTSSDCRAIDFLAMAGLSPWDASVSEFEVWLAARVRPIRVAGNSGPMKGETSWDDLGLPKEYTTVTKKERRVGEWDGELVRRAVAENGGYPFVKLAVTMADTTFPNIVGWGGEYPDASKPAGPGYSKTVEELDSWLTSIEDEVGARVRFVGTSPTTGLWRA